MDLEQDSTRRDSPEPRVIGELREALSKINFTGAGRRSFTGLPAMTHGFFPGGNGLFQGIDAVTFPAGGTLVLGSNFGRTSGFINREGRLLVQDERSNRTWKPLLHRFSKSGVSPDECFFSNAWPFLHEGASNLGPVQKWLQDLTLMESCVEFFNFTLARLHPTLIVALGTGPASFLSFVWPEAVEVWQGYSIPCLDELPMAKVRTENQDAVCVAITHPSMPNAWRRRPPYKHREGEIRLLTQAYEQSKTINRISA